jgi:hypothetical protein
VAQQVIGHKASITAHGGTHAGVFHGIGNRGLAPHQGWKADIVFHGLGHPHRHQRIGHIGKGAGLFAVGLADGDRRTPIGGKTNLQI